MRQMASIPPQGSHAQQEAETRLCPLRPRSHERGPIFFHLLYQRRLLAASMTVDLSTNWPVHSPQGINPLHMIAFSLCPGICPHKLVYALHCGALVVADENEQVGLAVLAPVGIDLISDLPDGAARD